MKLKTIFAGLCLALAVVCSAADAFQFAVWHGVPNYTNYDVSGLKLGIPASGGDASVWGWELALLSASSRDVTGLQTSFLFNESSWVDGMQAALLVNQVRDQYSSTVQFGLINLNGSLQFGLVNASPDAVQFGFLNFNENCFLPVFPLVNFSVK